MSTFVVVREAGPRWSDGGIHDQLAVDEHARFMDGLAGDGFVLFAGPLAGSEQGRVRALVVVEASDAEEIEQRLADDPWARAGLLVTASIEPWQIFVRAA
jgi:uncharacterized protein YciI